jgi:hypothetical protein
MAQYEDRLQKASLVSAPLQPHGNIFLRQKPFHVANGVGAEMENARGEDSVGFAPHIS